MTTIKHVRDEKTGRFQTTTNSSRYKNVQFNNRIMSEHAREWCIALNIPFIPKGFVVHHLDENKRNNHIDNLALMTITAHNRIHAHEAWNKGITAKDNEKWQNTVHKQRLEREKTFIIKAKESYELHELGLNYIEIGKKLNITRATASYRVNKYKKHLN